MPSFRFLTVRDNDIEYQRPDRSTRVLTLNDIVVPDGAEDKIAAAWQALIQAEIDVEVRLDSLPLNDPEHDNNFPNLGAAEIFFAAKYPAGNVFIERRAGKFWRVTRNEVVKIWWTGAAYQVKASSVG